MKSSSQLSHSLLADTWWCLFYMDSHDPGCFLIHASTPHSALGWQHDKWLAAYVISLSSLHSLSVNLFSVTRQMGATSVMWCYANHQSCNTFCRMQYNTLHIEVVLVDWGQWYAFVELTYYNEVFVMFLIYIADDMISSVTLSNWCSQ